MKTTKKKTKADKRFDCLKEQIAEYNPDALLADGLESALIGTAIVNDNTVACYDEDLAIRAFMKQGMTEEEAMEWYS